MTTSTDPNDSLDDLLGPRTASPKPDAAPPATYKPQDFTEPCRKCGGRGTFYGRNGRALGPCFTCKGAGKQTFKTSTATRAANRESRALSEERKAAATLEAFRAECTDKPVAAYVLDSSDSFAVTLREKLMRFGSLTIGQLEAVGRILERRLMAEAAKLERQAAAPVVDAAGVDRLKESFDKAKAFSAAKGKGIRLRNPKITIGGMTISPAKETSANPGALYVKSGDQYLGKIAGGKFMAARECSPDQEKQVLAFVADPKAAAKAYGQETGVCCICNATLKSEWRLKGIGPICSTKFGW